MKYVFYLLMILTLSGCGTSYFLFNVDEPVNVYQTQDLSTKKYTIPKGEQIVATKIKGKYRKVSYPMGSHYYQGYIVSHQFPIENRIDAGFMKNIVSSDPSINVLSQSASSGTSNSKLKPTNSSGTVHVNGYYRKDGTYVRPYTRSAPKKK